MAKRDNSIHYVLEKGRVSVSGGQMKTKIITVLALLFMLAVPPTQFAQSTIGTIQGVVLDTQKAVIAGATVTARNLETNASRNTLSNEEGIFRIPNLPIGNYEVTVELAGFGKYQQSGVTLSVNQHAVLEVTLKPAGVTEAVTVI